MSSTPRMTAADLAELGRAKRILENPSFVTKVTNVVGRPIERLVDILPEGATQAIGRATTLSLEHALRAAVATMGKAKKDRSASVGHKLAVGVTGAVGGAFGLPALAIELPVSTTVMLRSIADIARSKGEDVRSAETALACLQVFALSGTSKTDEAADSGYYAVRIALGRAVSEAATYLAQTGVVDESAPVLVRLLAKIASRFGVVVGEKAAAQIVPLVGAAGGATINVLLMDHFQTMAEGHFAVRRLERRYGEELVRAEYERLPR